MLGHDVTFAEGDKNQFDSSVPHSCCEHQMIKNGSGESFGASETGFHNFVLVCLDLAM